MFLVRLLWRKSVRNLVLLRHCYFVSAIAVVRNRSCEEVTALQQYAMLCFAGQSSEGMVKKGILGPWKDVCCACKVYRQQCVLLVTVPRSEITFMEPQCVPLPRVINKKIGRARFWSPLLSSWQNSATSPLLSIPQWINIFFHNYCCRNKHHKTISQLSRLLRVSCKS